MRLKVGSFFCSERSRSFEKLGFGGRVGGHVVTVVFLDLGSRWVIVGSCGGLKGGALVSAWQ